jgi:hypothetical protein
MEKVTKMHGLIIKLNHIYVSGECELVLQKLKNYVICHQKIVTVFASCSYLFRPKSDTKLFAVSAALHSACTEPEQRLHLDHSSQFLLNYPQAIQVSSESLDMRRVGPDFESFSSSSSLVFNKFSLSSSSELHSKRFLLGHD